MLEENEMKVLRKIVGNTKIDTIRNKQIREPCGIQPINEYTERRRRDRTNMLQEWMLRE